ncbi:hypothetical protein V8C42DRAFT_306145 [Trichoderma barbatum]
MPTKAAAIVSSPNQSSRARKCAGDYSRWTSFGSVPLHEGRGRVWKGIYGLVCTYSIL